MNHQEVFALVDKQEDYLVDVLRKLIAVDTSVPPGENYSRLLDLVEPEFKKFGFQTQRILMPEDKVGQISGGLFGPRPNLVARLDNGRPKLSVYAHMDVVPVDEHWTRDPFGGEVLEGKLYGRGAVDMKGSIACFLGAMKVLTESGIEPQFSIDALFCTDEELGVYPGARFLAEEGYFSNHILWLELGAIDPVVVIGAAGAIKAELTALGKSCHSGANFLGVNAVEEMIPILEELMALKRAVEKRTSRIPAFPLPGRPSDQMTPMFNLNIIRGGTKDNIVPGECRLTINRRYIIEENYQEAVAEIEAAVKRGLKRSRLLDLKMDCRLLYPPVEINAQSRASEKMRAAVKAVLGHDQFIYGGLGGSTDLGFVLQTLGPENVEVAIFGLLRAADIRAHAADEFVYVEDLKTLTKELVHYLAF